VCVGGGPAGQPSEAAHTIKVAPALSRFQTLRSPGLLAVCPSPSLTCRHSPRAAATARLLCRQTT